MYQPIPFWKETPFFRILLPFIGGIICQSIHPIPPLFLLIFSLLSFAGVFIFQFLSLPRFYQHRSIPGILFFILLFCLGSNQFRSLNNSFTPPANFTGLSAKNTSLVILPTDPVEKSKSFMAKGSYVGLSGKTRFISLQGNILIYFKKDSLIPPTGSVIAFRKQVELIENDQSGVSKSFRQWCKNQQIYYRVFLKPEEFIIIDQQPVSTLTRWLTSIRNWLTATLRAYIPGKKESGFAEALLIGYKSDLDPTLLQSYIASGVIHIIAISGLHLGIIYSFLNVFTKRIPSKFKLLSASLVVTGVWAFSFLAGLGPSVLRAACMCTLVTISSTFRKRSFSLNNLAASAFFLLFIDPSWLWDAGFLLSFFAVLGILIYHKPLASLITPSNPVFHNIWQLTALTIAAQVLTFPLCFFLFNRFPVYFLLANLPAIPLSTLTLIAEIALCLVAGFPMLAKPLGILIQHLIMLLNFLVHRISALPYASISGININLVQLVFLYFLIGIISVWLARKSKET